MPLVSISVLKGWSETDKRLISDQIHRALVDAFKIPESDYNHRIMEYDPDDFIYPKNRSEKYVVIEMSVFPGRSKTAKKELYQRIAANLGEVGIAENDVLVVLNEPPLENWGIAGKPGDEINSGSNLKG